MVIGGAESGPFSANDSVFSLLGTIEILSLLPCGFFRLINIVARWFEKEADGGFP